MDDIRRYYEKLEKNGFTTENGTSLKCPYCRSESLSYQSKSYGSFGLVEHVLVCGECNSRFGHWLYSSWEID